MNPKLVWLCSLLLVLACRDAELGETLTGAKIQVVGHGGSGFTSVDNYYPANSGPSILQAIDILGADGVEVDVQMTTDSILMLYHDEGLASQTDCSGCIAEQSYAAIAACRYRANIALNLGADARLWTLEDLLANFAGRPQAPWVHLDISISTDCRADFRTFARQLAALIRKYQAESWVYVEMSLLSELQYLQGLHGGLQLVWLGEVDEERLSVAEANGLWGVVTVNETIDKALVEEAHRRGLGVILYNVKIRQGTLEAVAKGPDLIETDNIPLLHAVLEEKD